MNIFNCFCCILVLVSTMTHALVLISLHFFPSRICRPRFQWEHITVQEMLTTAMPSLPFSFNKCLFEKKRIEPDDYSFAAADAFIGLGFLLAATFIDDTDQTQLKPELRGQLCRVVSQKRLRGWRLLVNNTSSRGHYSSHRGRWKSIASVHIWHGDVGH